MSFSKCLVKLRDAHGTVHVATVHAESLYEAVLRGLNQLTAVGSESDDDNTVALVEVEIRQEPTRHIVGVRKLLKLLEDKSARPGQEVRRKVAKTTWDAVSRRVQIRAALVLFSLN